ncbi:MAG: DUF4342 domain-containing protein [Thermochromatium sp.]
MINRGGYRPPDDRDVSGSDWLGKAKDLINQGHLRRLIVRRPNGRLLIDVPLTAGLAAIAVLIFVAPMLMALTALAALVMRFRVEVERDAGVYDDRDYD